MSSNWVHTDESAAQAAAHAHAHAFTVGRDIFFAAGRFSPHTGEGATRVAHELVHVTSPKSAPRRDSMDVRSDCGSAWPRPAQRGQEPPHVQPDG